MRVKSRRSILVGALLCCFCILGFIQPSVKAESKEILIGLVGPMSGRGADYGRMQKMGAELATEVINAKGGVRGYKIGFVASYTTNIS